MEVGGGALGQGEIRTLKDREGAGAGERKGKGGGRIVDRGKKKEG